MSLPYRRDLILRAKDLRKNATRQEDHLWYDYLNRYPVRFQRQKAISNYIVDFYCHSAKLIVELDGDQHGEAGQLEYEAVRTAELENQGLKILRFSNSDINQTFAETCMQIDHEVRKRLPGEELRKLSRGTEGE